MSTFFSLLLFLAAVLTGGHAAHWSYHGEHGPSHWGEMYATCAGSYQSPIDLSTMDNDNFAYDEALTNDLDFVKKSEVENYYLVNNGHSVKVDMVEAEVSLFGGNLGSTYRVVGPHFHWGSKNSQGSEHAFDGKHYPLELHIVTYDAEKYGSVKEAVESATPGALAVVGAMFKVVEEDNPALAPIIDHLHEVHRPDNENRVAIPFFPVKDLLPSETSEYFRYTGSLTTPTCNEVVTFTIMLHPQTISQKQLDKFRGLHEGDDEEGNPINLVNNFRPLQPLNGRKVTKSFKDPSIDNDNEIDSYAQIGDDASRPLIGPFIVIITVVTAAILL